MAAGAAARGQEADPKPSDYLKEEGSIHPVVFEGKSNAAIEYYKTWDSLTWLERRALGTAAGEVTHEPGVKLDKNQRQLCADHRAYIDSLLRVAAIPDCDWGINVEAGWYGLLPHLGFLRSSCRILGMDAHRCMEEGSNGGAAERVAAIIRVSDHLRTDKVLISSLVGASLCATGMRITEIMVKEDRLNPASARLVLGAMKSLPMDDLFGSTAAIDGERMLTVEWARRHFQGNYAGGQFLQEMRGLDLKGDWFNCFIYGMNEQRFGADLDRLNKYFELMLSAWRKPDHGAQLEELNAELREGQFGLVGRVMAPGLSRPRDTIDKVRADIQKTSAALEGIVRQDGAGAKQ
jgi:hypothetical protein